MIVCSPIGNTFFLVYLLHHYKKQGATIVYESQQQGKRYLLPPTTGDKRRGTAGPTSMDFSAVLGLTSTVYLFDCGGSNMPEPTSCDASTVVVSYQTQSTTATG